MSVKNWLIDTALFKSLAPGQRSSPPRPSDRTQGRRRVDPNRRRSHRPRPCDPRSRSPASGYLTGQTDGSTDCATLRRRERTRALGFAPLENEMWSQRRRSCRRSGEMWSHGPTGAAADGKCGHTSFFWCMVASRPAADWGSTHGVCRHSKRPRRTLLGARPSCGEWRANCPHGLWQTACRDHVHRG